MQVGATDLPLSQSARRWPTADDADYVGHGAVVAPLLDSRTDS